MNPKKIITSSPVFWSILIIGHVALLFFLIQNFGLSTANEGDKYLSRAEDFANGHFAASTQYQTFYTAYVIYLSIYKFLKLPTIFIFIGNYLLSLFAYWKFHQLLKSLFDAGMAKIWLLLIALSPLIQYWQLNLFSETFFMAVSLLFIHYCLFPDIRHRLLKAGLLAIIVVFSRPSGLFTVICIGLFTLYKSGLISKKNSVAFGVSLLILLFVFILFIFKLPYHDFAQYISNGSIYYGFPSWHKPELPPGDYTLFNCYEFLYHTKGLKTILILFIKKLDSFFVLSRPYYSNFHNWINQAHYVFYGLVFLGIFISNKQKNSTNFLKNLLVIILLNCLMIGLIFNEWSERHTLQVFPYILAISAYAISTLLKRFFTQYNSDFRQ